MAGINDFLPFAVDPSSNVLPQNVWANTDLRPIGHVPNTIANSALENKALRQATSMVAALGMLIADAGEDAKDNGDIETLKEALASMLRTMGGGSGQSKFTNEMHIVTADDITNGYYDLSLSIADTLKEKTVVFLNADAKYYGTDYTVTVNANNSLQRITFVNMSATVTAGDYIWTFWHLGEGVSPDPSGNIPADTDSITAGGTTLTDVDSINGVSFPANLYGNNSVYVLKRTGGTMEVGFNNATPQQAGVSSYATLNDLINGTGGNKFVSPAVLQSYLEHLGITLSS